MVSTRVAWSLCNDYVLGFCLPASIHLGSYGLLVGMKPTSLSTGSTGLITGTGDILSCTHKPVNKQPQICGRYCPFQLNWQLTNYVTLKQTPKCVVLKTN